MFRKVIITVICIMLVYSVRSQEKEGKYYLPYDLSSHTSLKFDTYLMNPALPLLGQEESNIGIYHRGQWFGFNNGYSSYGLGYGVKWSEVNAVNGLLYKHDLGVMTSYGLIGNYGHFVEISDQVGLRLGLNLMIGMSGVNKSKVIRPQEGLPTPLDSSSNVLMFNTMPGFDMNFGQFHLGFTAENIFDYAISSGEMAVPFSDKSYVLHAMYRYELMSINEVLEGGILSVLTRARKSANTFNLSASGLLEMPNLGWAYLGYGQNFGVYAGIGFNVSPYLSIGVGYEQGIIAKIPNLGGSYQLQVNYQFGGDRHIRYKRLQEAKRAKLAEKENKKKAEERAKKIAENKPEKDNTIAENKPTVPPVVKKEVEKPKEEPKKLSPIEEAENRLGVRKINDDTTPPGYYVVLGVYRNPRNAFKHISELRKNGYDAYGFKNPLNEMTYVNIGNAQSTPHAAEKLMMDNIQNKAFEGAWILKVSR